MKSKKGQTLGIAVMIAITLFIVGMLSINFIKDEVTRARGSTNLDCSNSADISDATKLTCLVVDLIVPYFIVIIISVSGGLIVAKFMM